MVGPIGLALKGGLVCIGGGVPPKPPPRVVLLPCPVAPVGEAPEFAPDGPFDGPGPTGLVDPAPDGLLIAGPDGPFDGPEPTALVDPAPDGPLVAGPDGPFDGPGPTGLVDPPPDGVLVADGPLDPVAGTVEPVFAPGPPDGPLDPVAGGGLAGG